MEKRKRTALVTGGSEGIGYELAKCFASRGYDLILAARSRLNLEKAAERLRADHDVQVSTFAGDLGAPGIGAQLASFVTASGSQVDVLVNNAGYGHYGAFALSDLETQLGIVDLNNRAVVELTHHFIGGMIGRRGGGVLNVASTAAFLPGPFMSVYYASKTFLLSFSEALSEETRNSGITVSCLCPGPTESRFRERAGTGETRLARSGKGMSSAEVARLGFAAFERGERVFVPGSRNKLMVRVIPFVPRNLALRFVRNLLRQEPIGSSPG